MSNAFSSARTPHGSTITQLPGHAIGVVPSDSQSYDEGVALYVGVAGDLTVVPADSESGDTVVFSAFPAGGMLPCRVKKVMGATTAGGLVGVY